MSANESRTTFFRQSGWMASAAIAGGVFNMLSTLLVFKMPGTQVNIFDTAQAALAILGIPALGLQAAFAAHAAGADTPERVQSLAGTMRTTLQWLTLAWLVFAGACVVFQHQLLAQYGLPQPALLWIVIFGVLVTLWTPIATGVLQGRQDFLWVGWSTLLNGAGRFAVLAVIVMKLKMGALGGLVGVLAGAVVVLALVTWRTRDILRAAAGKVDWRPFLRRVVPLTFGLGVLVTLMQADALVVREKLQPLLTDEQQVGYTASRRIGQVLVYLVGAFVAVMYPKVARSFQRTEPSEVLKLTLILTSLTSALGAIATSVAPQIPLRLLGATATPENMRLVIAYVWALLPLALSNVLVWNLLARECYRVVPLLTAIAVLYWFALRHFGGNLLAVAAIVGLGGAALLAVCGVATMQNHRANRRETTAITA